MQDLLDPLNVDAHMVHTYMDQITSYSTTKLQDDYQMIWLHLPESGYGEIKCWIDQIRTSIIEELKIRPPVPWRPRLQDRIKFQMPTWRSNPANWLGYDYHARIPCMMNPDNPENNG